MGSLKRPSKASTWKQATGEGPRTESPTWTEGPWHPQYEPSVTGLRDGNGVALSWHEPRLGTLEVFLEEALMWLPGG